MSNSRKRIAVDPKTQPALFSEQAAIADGSWDTRLAVKAAMSEAMRRCKLSRWEIAAEISRRVGRDITKSMLDNYTAESKEDCYPPFYIMAAFCAVVGDWEPYRVSLAPAGGDVVFGEELEIIDDYKREQEIRRMMEHENERRRRAGKPPIDWTRK